MLRYFILLMLLSLSISNTAESKSSTEIYIDVSTQQQIKVKFKHNHILVRHLTGNSWSRYVLVGPAVFSNRRGSTIYLKNDNRLVWRSKKYGQQITFRKLEFGVREDYRRGQEYPQGYDEPRFHTDNLQLEGVWFEPQLGRELILIDGRSGIKLKFRGAQDWTYFEKTGNGNYIDNLGNTYTVLANRTLRWTNANRTKSFVIEKRSDTIDWN